MISIRGFIFFFSLPLSLTLAAQNKKTLPPQPFGPLPSAAQMQWHQMETNAFIHFSTNTFTGKEWGYGNESPAVFNPSELNAEQWAKTLKEAGFKMMILTCKHHDGFCLWPSKFTTHSVKNSPYKNGEGDVVKEVSDAAKKYGIKFGLYLSPWDRNRADYGQPSYISYYRRQLKELFTAYAPVTEMWFDGANGGDGYYGGANEKRPIDGKTYYSWPATLDMVREMNSDVIFFSDAGPGVRWVGNERGMAGTTNWNLISPDTLYAGKGGIEELLNTGSEDGTAWIPAEVDVSIRPGWFYHDEENDKVKTPQQLFAIYLTSVGRGSTLLLNVPPDKRGLLHEEDVNSLQGFKALLDSVFTTNKAVKAIAIATNTRGRAATFAATNVTDDDSETYWATDDKITSASVEIKLAKPSTINYILLQEYIKLGQRVKAFTAEAWFNGRWKKIASGTTIGYKRILKIEPLKTSRIKITINKAKACPVISNMALY